MELRPGSLILLRVVFLFLWVALARPVRAGEYPFPSPPIVDDYSPDLVVSADGTIWVVWVSSRADTSAGGPADRVYASQNTGGMWQSTEMSSGPGRYLNPRAVATPSGIAVTWVSVREDDANVLLRRWEDGPGPIVSVAAGPAREFAPSIAASPDGIVWVAWQEDGGESYDVRLARVGEDAVDTVLVVADGPANDRHPDLVIAPDGLLWVAWSTVRSEHTEVALRRLESFGWGAPLFVTAAPHSSSLYPSIATDDSGRVWIAYYHWNRSWSGFDDLGGEGMDLGSVRLVVWDGVNLGVPFGTAGNTGRAPRPTMEEVGYVAPDNPIRVYGHRPLLRIDAEGRPWLFAKLNGYLDEDGVISAYWGIYGVFYDGSVWSSVPEIFVPKNGHFWDRPAAAFDGSGRLWLASVRDRRDVQPIRTNQNLFGPDADIRVDTFRAMPGSGVDTEVTGGHAPSSWTDGVPREVPRFEIHADEGDFGVYWGDSHRHTCDFSCDGIWDYTFEETYVHTFERIGYDWIAPADHVQWWSPLVWAMVSKWTDLYRLPGRLATLPGYERTGRVPSSGGSGDQNALYFGTSDFRSTDPAPDSTVCWSQLYHRFQGRDVLLAPHHTADRSGYTIWSDLLEADTLPSTVPLVEVFQITRGSAECPDCPLGAWHPHVGPDTGWVSLALEAGLRLGFIAGGDHNWGNGFTAVLAEDGTEESIFRALRARRCYGTSFSRKIFVDFRVNGRLMGGEIESATFPQISYRVMGTEPLSKITIVKNGDQEWFWTEPGTLGDSATFVDPAPIVPGTTAWYYMRVEEGDSGVAWTSPVWVDFVIPTGLEIAGPAPHPAQPVTIRPRPFLPARGALVAEAPSGGGRLLVFDTAGRLVRDLRDSGEGRYAWNGLDSSGRASPPWGLLGSLRIERGRPRPGGESHPDPLGAPALVRPPVSNPRQRHRRPGRIDRVETSVGSLVRPRPSRGDAPPALP